MVKRIDVTLEILTARRHRLAEGIQSFQLKMAQLDQAVADKFLAPDFAETARKHLLSSLKKEVPELTLITPIPQPVTIIEGEKPEKRAYRRRISRVPVPPKESEPATGVRGDEESLSPVGIPDEEQAVESLLPTPRQVAILCNEIRRKNGWLLRYGKREIEFTVNEACQDTCRRLDSQGAILPVILNANDELKRERQEALGKMRDLVDEVIKQDEEKHITGKKYLFDQLDTNMQDLVVQFIDWSESLLSTNLYAFLASVTSERDLLAGQLGYDEAQVREIVGSTKIWYVTQPFPERVIEISQQATPLVPTCRIPAANEELLAAFAPDTVILPVNEEVVTGATTLPQPEKQKAHIKQEETIRVRRERIKKCLWKIFEVVESQSLHFNSEGIVWGGANVSRVFNWLTTKVQTELFDRKIITPVLKSGSRTSSHKPGFSISDLAIAVYYHEFDQQITKKIASNLAEIVDKIKDNVREEFEEQQRQKKS